MKFDKLIVYENGLLHSRFFYLFLIGLFIFVAIGGYFFGQYRAGFNLLEAKEIEAELKTAIYLQEQQKAEVQDQLAIAKRANQVDVAAHQQIKIDLKDLQQENFELREEVDFYRGIVAPRESSQGLRIDQFSVTKTSGHNLYHFTLVLTQVKKNQRFTRGSVKLTFEGAKNGLPKTLALNQLSVEKKKDLKFKFRYFQKLEGDLVLPDGFIPRQVLVNVIPRKKKNIQSHFDWPYQNNVTVDVTEENDVL